MIVTSDCPVWDETFSLDFGQGRSPNDLPPDGTFVVGVYGMRVGAASLALGHSEVRPMNMTQMAQDLQRVGEWKELLGEMVGDTGGACGIVQ